MRLKLMPPAGWRDDLRGGLVTIAGDVRIDAAPLMGKPDLPPLADADVIHVLEGHTHDGWPLHVVGHPAAAGGRPIRLTAVVEVLTLVAVATAHALDPESLAKHHADLLAIFASARPGLWDDEPVTIAELWSMADA